MRPNGVIHVIDSVMILADPNATAAATASATASEGLLGLPGFEPLYAVVRTVGRCILGDTTSEVTL